MVADTDLNSVGSNSRTGSSPVGGTKLGPIVKGGFHFNLQI